jgi:L-fuconate dehydratase
MIEYVDQQHDYFEHPIQVSGGTYKMPVAPGYSTKIKLESIKDYIYPTKSETLQLYQDIIMLKKWKIKKPRHPKLVIKPRKGQQVNKKIADKATDQVDNEIRNGKKNGKRGKKIKAGEKHEPKDEKEDGKKDAEEDGKKDEKEDEIKDEEKHEIEDAEKDKMMK